MSKRWRQLQETLAGVSGLLDRLDRRTEKLETILMVREPSSTAAADAYEGLRKQVVAAAADRLAHLAQLAQLDAALGQGAEVESLAKVVRGWAEQASLGRVADPGHPDQDLLFVMVADLGGPVEVLEPAYVDTVTGRVIRQGRARRAAVPPPAQPAPAAPDPAEAAPATAGQSKSPVAAGEAER